MCSGEAGGYNIKYLDLSQNQIGFSGFCQIALALKSSQALLTLNVAGNDMKQVDKKSQFSAAQ